MITTEQRTYFDELCRDAYTALEVPPGWITAGGSRKDRQTTAYRERIVILMLNRFPMLSTPALAALFGFQTHSTIVKMLQRIRERMGTVMNDFNGLRERVLAVRFRRARMRE